MGKGVFITATGTDVGKTYITGLIVKKLQREGHLAGYYKAALSGAVSVKKSDAGYVKQFSGITQSDETLVSYMYKQAVSPHLASRLEKKPVRLDKVYADYMHVKNQCEYVTVEGSGGIVCPILWEKDKKILLEDLIKEFKLPVVLVADSGLGTINVTTLTAAYLKDRKMEVKGIIMNHFNGSAMHQDNMRMIEELTQIPVVATVKEKEKEIKIGTEKLLSFFA